MPNAKEGEFYCTHPRCQSQGKSRTFSRIRLLRQHQLKVHAEKTLKCRQCSKAFSVAYLLRQHEAECNVSFECSHCGGKFAYRSSLKRHYRNTNHGPSLPDRSGADSLGAESKCSNSSIAKSTTQQMPTIVNILPLQIIPVIVQSSPSVTAVGTTGKASMAPRERSILPKKAPQKVASVQATRPILPKLTVSTQVDCVSLRHPFSPSRDLSESPSSSRDLSTKKMFISTSTSTVTEEVVSAPSISTQTETSQMCNVAVGIDEVFDDLQKLFDKADAYNASTNTEQPPQTNNDLRRDELRDEGHFPNELQSVPCPLNPSTSFNHAATQTLQPLYADTHIQTSLYDDPPFDDSFLATGSSQPHQRLREATTFVDVGVGGPFDERIFGHMEVQTFEPQVHHFGMQTSGISESLPSRQTGNIAETQTLCISALDNFSQTGNMELSSVETQTIEQLFDSFS